MASILDRYGIKEVADVTFYNINSDGTMGIPVLYLDTLKVSTIEQTAETADARGGKGNPKLVTWDYGKEITVSIEDALFSPKSMAIMFGNGVASAKSTGTGVTRTAVARVVGSTDTGTLDFITMDVVDSVNGAIRKKVDLANDSARAGYVNFSSVFGTGKCSITKVTKEDGTAISDGTSGTEWTRSDLASAVSSLYGEKIFITYTQPASKSEIIISGDTFPGTYYVTGDTYARSDVDGKDQFFQFVIPKAKVTSENTITLEAEGDPSVFSMNLTVLRPEDGEMMKLVQYDLV